MGQVFLTYADLSTCIQIYLVVEEPRSYKLRAPIFFNDENTDIFAYKLLTCALLLLNCDVVVAPTNGFQNFSKSWIPTSHQNIKVFLKALIALFHLVTPDTPNAEYFVIYCYV